MEYVIMIGLPLSGKSSYRKTNFYDNKVVSLQQFGNRKAEIGIIEELLKEGKNVVVDDTNITKKIRKIHIDLAKKYNAKIIGIFMDTPVGLIRQRRWRRPDQMHMAVINKMKKELEIPEKEEGFNELKMI